MRYRRVQFDAYSGQFQSGDSGFSRDRDDVDAYVIPDFSSEDFPLPEDLEFLEAEKFLKEK